MAKGANFEREIAKTLSLWWNGGDRDDVFWRSTQSGGRATQRAKGGKKTSGSYGDLSCLSREGQEFLNYFCTELKVGYGGSASFSQKTFMEIFKQATTDPGKAIKKFKTLVKKALSNQVTILDIMDSNQKVPTLISFWNQCERDRELGERKESMVIFKRDRKTICCLVSYCFLKEAIDWHGRYTYDCIQIRRPGEERACSLFIVRFDELFSWLNPEFFKQEKFR